MKKQVLGFNTWGNNGIHQRTTVGVGLGKLRNTTGSTTRVYNYCSQTSANPLACALGIKPQASVISTVPDAPVLTTVIEGNQTLTVNFTQGSDGGSAITNYQYRFLDVSGSSYYDFSPPLIASPAIFTGLTTGHTSYIALKAKNANGTSIPSNIISGTPT